MVRRIVLALLCGTALPGCSIAVNALHKDQDLIRCALLDLYTNQIMDNLVRAANGMPIIQLDYSQAQGTITIRNTIGGSDNQAATVSNVLALPAATLSATRTIVTTLMGDLTDENTNQVAVVATPVITSNEVYDAYLEYLSLPDSLIVSCDPPPPGAAHLCKKYNGNYFWVPVFRRGDFFKLALLTTAQRGKTLLAPDPFFSVMVKSIEEEREGQRLPGGKPARTKNIIVRLDRKIPNDTGYLKFDSDKIEYDIVRYEKPGVEVSEPEFATVVVPNTEKDLGDFRKKIPGTAKIYLDHRQPKAPSTEDLLKRVNFQLQQIQFNRVQPVWLQLSRDRKSLKCRGKAPARGIGLPLVTRSTAHYSPSGAEMGRSGDLS